MTSAERPAMFAASINRPAAATTVKTKLVSTG